MAADVGKGLDLGLHIELVGAAVAAADNDDVVLGDVDHGDGIVDGRMRDIDAAVGKAGALAVRALGECDDDIEPASGEKAAIDAGKKRQRAGGAEDVDVQHRRRGGGRGRRQKPKTERKRHHAADLIYGWHPGRLFPSCPATRVRPVGRPEYMLVPGIHVLLPRYTKDVDGRDKPGHDGFGEASWLKRSNR